jgi:AcrR family transcriptional regulator
MGVAGKSEETAKGKTAVAPPRSADRILQSATELFDREGIRAVGVGDVVRGAVRSIAAHAERLIGASLSA